MTDERELATVRTETSLMPDFLGISAVGVMAYLLACLILFGIAAVSAVALGMSAVGILSVIAAVIIVEIIVGLALLACVIVAPTYLATWRFVVRRLRRRYGQQAYRHDDLSPRHYPGIVAFGAAAEDDSAETDADDADDATDTTDAPVGPTSRSGRVGYGRAPVSDGGRDERADGMAPADKHESELNP